MSLIKDKIYEGRKAQKRWFILVDESGEEYGYPPNLFEVIEDEKNENYK
jgi:hypothetical protein